MNWQVSTYNCRGLRDKCKRQKVFKWLREKKQDVYFLQETHSCVGDEVKWQNEWGGTMVCSHGTKDSKGVMVLIRNNSDTEIVKVESIVENGRVLVVEANIKGLKVLLVNIYAPNEDSPDFFKHVLCEVSSKGATNIIIGGDFNLVLDLKIDKNGGRPSTNNNAQKYLIEQMDVLDMVDIWRLKNPKLLEYTWCRRKPSVIQCRLDFFLVSSSLINITQSAVIKNGFLSDHSIVNLGINVDTKPRGPGYWKLNCSLLKDIEYVNSIKDVIKECEIIHDNSDVDEVLYWETLKMQIRGASIKYAAAKREARKTNGNKVRSRN